VGRQKRFSASVAILALLSACGGGGSSGGSGGGDTAITPPPPPPSTPPPAQTAGCTLRERQDWAAANINEWYLFPTLLASGVNPASFSSVQDYINALVAPARAQSRDRFFTYVTSIQEENAFFQSGASAGFGFRLVLDQNNRLLNSESFEGGPALAAGIDRGTQIIGIGTTTANVRSVESILATEGGDGLNNALGPSTAGTTRVLQVSNADGTVRTVSVTKAEFSIDPVSSRYGARILDDNGKRVGYINLRTFIGPADPALRSAFAQFRAQGITEVVVDLRYNGGGLLSIAALMNNLLQGNRTSGQIMGFRTFRASKSADNVTDFFQPQSESIASAKIAFIGTDSSASASELVMNASLPYLRQNVALIGTDTFGKPVGQIVPPNSDRPACDDRMRVVAFQSENADRQGDYYTGLASKFANTCRAPDDLTRQFGDPQEASVRAALDFLAGRQCVTGPITGGGATTQSLREGEQRKRLLTPAAPSASQREMPGLF